MYASNAAVTSAHAVARSGGSSAGTSMSAAKASSLAAFASSSALARRARMRASASTFADAWSRASATWLTALTSVGSGPPPLSHPSRPAIATTAARPATRDLYDPTT